MNNRAKAIAITAILASGLLVACGTATSGVGPAASIAQAQANATATSEAAATATENVRLANERAQAAYDRATKVAQGGINATLSAQDQTINDLAIAQMRARATESADMARVTRTAVAVRQTADASHVTATAQAIQHDNDNRASAVAFDQIMRIIILVAVIIVISLATWKFHTHNSVRELKNGAVVSLEYPLYAWLMPWKGWVPTADVLIPAPGTFLPAPKGSAEPARLAEPVTYSKSDKLSYEIPADAIDREHEYWTELTIQFLNDIKAKHGGSLKSIPHYRQIPSASSKSGSWNSGPWVAVTNCLSEAGAIDKKQGAKTIILNNRDVDALIAAVESGEVGITPPPRVGADDKKKEVETVMNSEQSAQLEQSKQRVFTKKEMDDAIRALPGIDR